MQLRRFEGRDMRQLLQQVKAEMGEDAVLLHTRPARTSLMNRLLGRPQVEAWAALDASTPANSQNSPAEPAMVGENLPSRALDTQSTNGVHIGPTPAITPHLSWRMGLDIHPAQPGAEQLMRCGVDAVAAWEIAWAAAKAGHQEVLNHCFRVITSEGTAAFSAVLPKGVVVLVGPTGAGKTTTIAKLAAQVVLEGRRQVAMMTVDTYRIAAIDQLRTYARIMDVPLLVAHSEGEVRKLLKQARKQFDLILVDTTGRSQRHTEHLTALTRDVDACGAEEVHLVLPAVNSLSDLLASIEHFESMRPSRFIFTKLDETWQPGVLASVAWRNATPIAFVTTGQSVPEDIQIATQQRLARGILPALESADDFARIGAH